MAEVYDDGGLRLASNGAISWFEFLTSIAFSGFSALTTNLTLTAIRGLATRRLNLHAPVRLRFLRVLHMPQTNTTRSRPVNIFASLSRRVEDFSNYRTRVMDRFYPHERNTRPRFVPQIDRPVSVV
jgi:hypothetical protein